MKISSFVVVVTLLLALFQPTGGAVQAEYFVLEGGINTVEGWYSAYDGDSITVVTTSPFHAVGTAYTSPYAVVDVLIRTEKDLDPVIGRGIGSYDWNEEGYWHLVVEADSSGVVEVILHVTTIYPLPGNHVTIEAWSGVETPQQWDAWVSTGEYRFSLGGGVNTVEGWYGATDGSVLEIVTKEPFDVVVTANTEPGFSAHLTVGLEKEEDPMITRGTGSYEWNPQGFWELAVVADSEGVAEVVVHVEGVKNIPGDTIFVRGWFEDQTPQAWTGNVSTGEYPFALGGGINTAEGWYDAKDGSVIDIVTTESFDVVPTIFTAPELQVNIKIETLFDEEPVIVTGIGSYEWNPEGYWEILITANSDGVAEVVVNVAENTKDTITVTAWYGDQKQEQWVANVSSGLVTLYLPLICNN